MHTTPHTDVAALSALEGEQAPPARMDLALIEDPDVDWDGIADHYFDQLDQLIFPFEPGDDRHADLYGCEGIGTRY